MNRPEQSETPAETPVPAPATPVVDQYEAGRAAAARAGERYDTSHMPPAHPRRLRLPIMLFLATCLSTFWVGAASWSPPMLGQISGMQVRQMIVAHWQAGLLYMACVLGILFAHEMGHFVATIIYRIPASLPYFIPIPISPIGTMGAVIGMDGLRANRRQMFDIGLAGPLAGLVVAIPVMCIGIAQLHVNPSFHSNVAYDCPLLVQWLIQVIKPELLQSGALLDGETRRMVVYHTDLNPFFMAGWVGLLITGLNMFPISQLDGGHVIYALFLKRAHVLARGFLFVAIMFIIVTQAYMWLMMVVLVTLLGTDHPPTANDRMELGTFRTVLGYASLSLPVLCFPAQGLIQTGFWN